MPLRVIYSSKGIEEVKEYLKELNPTQITDRDADNVFIRKNHVAAHVGRVKSTGDWDGLAGCVIPEGAATRIWFRDDHYYLGDRDRFCKEGEALYRSLLKKTGRIEIRNPISHKAVRF